MTYRINFTIPHTNFNLVAYDPSIFIQFIPKKDGRQVFSEWYIEYKDGTTTSFIEINVIEKLVNHIRDKIILEPDWADSLHIEAENINKNYFEFAKNIRDVDVSEIGNQELYELYRDLREHQIKSHTYAVSTTWFLDSDGEVYTNYLKEQLKAHLNTKGSNDTLTLVEYFTILTTPYRENFAMEEQIEFLTLLQTIKQSGGDVHNFLEDIELHYKKWHWVPYGYIGPAYTLDYYIDRIGQELKTENIDELISIEKTRSEKLKNERDELLEKIDLPADLKHLFDIARDIIWLKDYRKYCLWHGHYVLDLLTAEIAKRLHISHRQANHMLTPEAQKSLVDGDDVDEHLLNERILYTLIHSTENGSKFYYGEKAKHIRESFDIEEIEIDRSHGFKGTCACPGVVKGEVKIVNSMEDIGKVNDGDIMLALTTYPSMLPAMKRASAIVTEDGGITCHAAIVSREFKIPCVVGVKKICSMLKDGDIVKVDATDGTITNSKK